jgi:hypothetical protein
MTSPDEFIDALLRQQPLRRAPPGFEERVLRRIAQQSARSWYQLGFSHWPRSAQWLVLPLAAVLMSLLALLDGPLGKLLQGARDSAPVGAAEAAAGALADLGHALQTLGEVVARSIPSAWLYAGAGLAALLYVALFGIGAAAFRTLVMAPQRAQY